MTIDNLLWMLLGTGLGIGLSMLVLSVIAWSDRRLGNVGAAAPSSEAARAADLPPLIAERKPAKRKRPPLMPMPDNITSLEALDRPLLAPEGDALLARSADVPVAPPAADATGQVVVTPLAAPVAAADAVPGTDEAAPPPPERGSADWWAEQGIAETIAAGQAGPLEEPTEVRPAPPVADDTISPAAETLAPADPEATAESAAPAPPRPARGVLTPPPRRVSVAPPAPAVATASEPADPVVASADEPEAAVAPAAMARDPEHKAEPLVDLDAAFAAVLDVAPPAAAPDAPPAPEHGVAEPVRPVVSRPPTPRPAAPRLATPRPVPPRPVPRAAPPPAAAVPPIPPAPASETEPERPPEPQVPEPASARPNRMPQLPEEVPGVIVGGVRFAPVPKRPTLPKSPIAGDKSSPASE